MQKKSHTAPVCPKSVWLFWNVVPIFQGMQLLLTPLGQDCQQQRESAGCNQNGDMQCCISCPWRSRNILPMQLRIPLGNRSLCRNIAGRCCSSGLLIMICCMNSVCRSCCGGRSIHTCVILPGCSLSNAGRSTRCLTGGIYSCCGVCCGLCAAFGYCGSGCRACDMCSAAGLWCSCGCGAGPARRCPGCCCRHRMFRCCLCCMNRGMCGYHADNRACTGSCCRCLLGCQRGSRICGYGGRSSCRCCNNSQLRCGCRCGSRCLRRYCGCLPCRDACCSACYSVTGGICGMRG